MGLGKGRGNRGSRHIGGKKSRAEGTGRFMVRVISTTPAVMDSSAEKAAIPRPPPPLYHVHMGHPQHPTILRPMLSCTQTFRHSQ